MFIFENLTTEKSIVFTIKDFGIIKTFETIEFSKGISLLDLVQFSNIPGTNKTKRMGPFILNNPSKGDFRRLIRQNGLRINDRVVKDPDYIITFADFDDDSNFIWITRGKKVKHEVFVILTEAPITEDEFVWQKFHPDSATYQNGQYEKWF